tara:strand:+ start:4593 stop:4988 length:396 start_codon:yes stop_codon:yes gene_type:complete
MTPTHHSVHQAWQKLKSELTAQIIVLLVLCATSSFWVGRYTTPTSDEDFVCRTQISNLKSKKREVKGLLAKNELLASQNKELQDSCDTRLRSLIKRQQGMCNIRVTKRLSTEREAFILFKCANCKRLGKCK